MKLFKILILLISYFCIFSNANALCKFKLNISDDISLFVEEFNNTPQRVFIDQKIARLPAIPLCPGEGLEGYFVEYNFIEDELLTIKLIAQNDKKNTVSNKLGLYKYVERNYGSFNNSNENPVSWNNFVSWNDDKNLTIYKKLFNNQIGRIDEELYITTIEADKKLLQFEMNKELKISEVNQ